MASHISSTKATLSYPLYAGDFDPENDNCLVVGGGGGEGRSGVGNKITVLDTSTDDISETAEIDLSRDEDSVTSLAVLHQKQGLVALAGINSSTADQQAGKNEHLRSFGISVPSGADASDEPIKEKAIEKRSISQLSQASLFTPSTAPKKETYQRVIRLSPSPRGRPGYRRFGTVATGLAPEGELVVFDANTTLSKEPSIVGRVNLKKEEAADVDLIEPREGVFKVAYCTDYEVYEYNVTHDSGEIDTSAKPKFLYGIPHPDVFQNNAGRPTFRALRFLTPHFILLLANRPRKSGSELFVLDTRGGTGEVILRKRLHRSMKAATGLEVAFLNADAAGNLQIVVAVAGQDISVEILTIDYSPTKDLSKFRVFIVLRDVHSLQITGIKFSRFSHSHKPHGDSTAPAARLRLASISMGNTVVVHTLPLTVETSSRNKKSRYVLTTASTDILTATFSVTFSLIAVVVIAILLQALLEVRGVAPPYFGVADRLPPAIRDHLVPHANPVIPDAKEFPKPLSDQINSIITSAGGDSATIHVDNNAAAAPTASAVNYKRLRHLLASRNRLRSRVLSYESDESESIDETIEQIAEEVDVRSPGTIIVVDSHNEISAELRHDDELIRQEGLKRWEELEHHQREGWKRRLVDAGEWAVEEGETALKGIFFRELAGLVGHAVRGD
ncbi:hypothetical protein L228DRAFT_285999 [Xylona heveae TC161]|uniref:Guanine nucleotide-exchange factor SEC12 n=1 Tax=Xylona heveae (strain CBS 132557 / TC161) TaxID=1328760 RepID=A0A164ZIB8_XYLHT|nr:hypothetical protein L228DRAFT_285999 [Xylona heveae TC161]KZF19133.1 hypothetical protein L228DRAFT_285999 [Xylona heveae TC161]